MKIELADCECDVCGYRWFGIDGKPLRCAGCRGERWTQTVVRHDLQKLPSVPITQRRDLPACPGIYFVFSADELIYVGVAQQIDSRWNQHERVPRLLHMPDVRIAWLEVADRSGTALAELEMSLIAYLRPPMNGKGPLPLPTAKQRVGLQIRSDAMKAWHAAANATGLTRTQYLEHVLLEPSEFTLAEDVRVLLSEHSRSSFNVADKRPTRTEIIEEAVRVWAAPRNVTNREIAAMYEGVEDDERIAEQQVKADQESEIRSCRQCGDPCSFDRESGIWRHHTRRQHAAKVEGGPQSKAEPTLAELQEQRRIAKANRKTRKAELVESVKLGLGLDEDSPPPREGAKAGLCDDCQRGIHIPHADSGPIFC